MKIGWTEFVDSWKGWLCAQGFHKVNYRFTRLWYGGAAGYSTCYRCSVKFDEWHTERVPAPEGERSGERK